MTAGMARQAAVESTMEVGMHLRSDSDDCGSASSPWRWPPRPPMRAPSNGRATADALTLDPHAQNEGPTHNLLHQIYEPLILRDRTGKLLPTLAALLDRSRTIPRCGSSSCARA